MKDIVYNKKFNNLVKIVIFNEIKKEPNIYIYRNVPIMN